jgi:hypothetical protein
VWRQIGRAKDAFDIDHKTLRFGSSQGLIATFITPSSGFAVQVFFHSHRFVHQSGLQPKELRDSQS